MRTKQALKLLLGIACALFFGYLALRDVQFDALLTVLQSLRWPWLVAGLLAFGAGYAARIERWRQMLLRANAQLTWQQTAGPLLASFAANNVLPFRAGDVLRAFAFKQQLQVDSPIVLATLLTERLLDFLWLLLLLGLALLLLGVDVNRLAGVGGGFFLVTAAIITLALLRPALLWPLFKFFLRILHKLAPALAEKMQAKVQELMDTLLTLAQGTMMARLMLWSSLAWVAEGLLFWCAAQALPAISEPLAAWLALPIGTLSTLIPSTPGYVGTFDFFVKRAMGLLGNSQNAAAAYALLVHFLLWLPPTLIGGLYFLLRKTPPTAPKTRPVTN